MPTPDIPFYFEVSIRATWRQLYWKARKTPAFAGLEFGFFEMHDSLERMLAHWRIVCKKAIIL